MIKDFECLRVDDDEACKASCPVAEEVPLSIFINGRHFATAMISPQLKREFVAGHLYSERIVSSVQEIESIEVEGDVVRVIVANPIRAIVPRRPIVSGCGGIASFLDESKLPRIKSDLRINKDQAQEAMKAISLSQTHIATGGVHSVGLFDQSGPVSIIEDIGRHNALDKAIGSLILREGGVRPGPDVCRLHRPGIFRHGIEVLCGRHPHSRLPRGDDDSCHNHCPEDGAGHHRFSPGKEAVRLCQSGEVSDLRLLDEVDCMRSTE